MLFGSRLNKLAAAIKKGLSRFAVDSKEPNLAFDFVDNYYRTNGSDVTLSSALTHVRNGNATMVDGYGPELVTNGTFDSDSGWTLGTGITIVEGKAVFSSVANGQNLRQPITLDAGSYVVQYEISEYEAGAVSLWGPNYLEDIQRSANGIYTELVYFAGSGNLDIKARSTTTLKIDNVSVREMPVLKWAPHNLLTYSEDFSNAAWVKSNSTVTSNVSTAPDGTESADLLVPDTGSNFHGVQATVSSASPTFSVYLKAGGYNYAIVTQNGTSNTSVGVDLSSGVLTSNRSGIVLQSIESVGDGWYKVSMATGAASINVSVYVSDVEFTDASTFVRTWSGDGTSGVYIWGAHAYRSDLGGMVDNPDRGDSYVPTTSSAVYRPRIGHHEYNGSVWVNRGLLAESEARTNLITYSQDFTGLGWVRTRTGVLALDSVGPDGQENSAVKLIDSNAGGTGQVYVATGNKSVDTSSSYTFSIYAKKDQLDSITIYHSNFTTPANNGWVFDLSAGTISAFIGVPDSTAAIQDVGNGWYRCSVTFTTDVADTNGEVRVYLSNASTVDLDGTSSVLIYGAQFEKGSVPSSLIPTSGSTVTRAAETFTVPSANLPWPTAEVIGPELVTNGTFDTDVSGWSIDTARGTISWQSGVLRVTNDQATGFPSAYQLISGLTVGKVYRMSSSVRGTNARLRVTFTALDIYSSSDITSASFVQDSVVFVATATTATVYAYCNEGGNTGNYAEFDNISVREINPLSVSIQMQGRMTYADTSKSTEAFFLRWGSGVNPSIEVRLNTLSARTGQVDFYQLESVLDAVESSSTAYSPGILVPYNTASRHGSTFLNAAIDGTALTANTTPTALPDLSATNLSLAPNYMGTINQFRVWSQDLGDTGIVEATEPSLEPSLSLTFDSTDSSFIVRDFT